MSKRRLLATVGWATLAPAAAFAALRLLGVADRRPLLFALETLTPAVLLPAWLAVVAGALARRAWLAAAAVLVVLLQIVWTGPDLRWWALPEPRARGDSITIVAANVRADNVRRRATAARLLALAPDVLVIEEYTPELRSVLVAGGILDRYPGRIEDARAGFFGSAIYSRFPLLSSRRFELGRLPATTATLSLPGGSIDVVAVHTIQPLADFSQLRAQLRQLARLRASYGGPLILAGDFNATSQQGPFRALLSHRLRDAHLVRGKGAIRTWPVGEVVPPFARLDHVLVSPDVAVLGAGEASVPGSDHRAVTARVALAAPSRRR